MLLSDIRSSHWRLLVRGHKLVSDSGTPSTSLSQTQAAIPPESFLLGALLTRLLVHFSWGFLGKNHTVIGC